MAKNIKKPDEPKQPKEAEKTTKTAQNESNKEKVTSKSTSEKKIKKATKTNQKTKAKAVKPVAKKKQAKVKKTKAPVKKKDAKRAKFSKKAGKQIEKKDTDDKETNEEVEIVDEELEDEEEEEEQYIVKQKPELTPEMKRKLRLRKDAKKKKPKFKRQEWFRYKKLNDSWRKPRGLHSKLRTNRKYRINRVRIGYGTTADVRGLHASGFKEILVYNKSDLEKLDPKQEAARIGHSVGTRKRIEIEEYADELGIRILNRGL